MIYGYSGSGKSTLAKLISQEYSLPILYIDKTLYNANWERKTHEETINEIQQFIKSNKNWIIDGNGTSKLFKERAQLADKIIFMDLGRWQCYKNVKQRFKDHKQKNRDSRPDGCEERFPFSFRMWVLFNGRKKSRRTQLNSIIHEFANKAIIIKNKKDITYFKENMDTLLLK